MAKYGALAQKKVKRAMEEMKEGKLKSGRSGKKVTNPKQAVAIGLSEAREAGGKVPKKASTTKRATAKKTTARKSAARKTTAKSTAGRSTAAKSTAKKTTAKKSGSHSSMRKAAM